MSSAACQVIVRPLSWSVFHEYWSSRLFAHTEQTADLKLSTLTVLQTCFSIDTVKLTATASWRSPWLLRTLPGMKLHDHGRGPAFMLLPRHRSRQPQFLGCLHPPIYSYGKGQRRRQLHIGVVVTRLRQTISDYLVIIAIYHFSIKFMLVVDGVVPPLH